MAGVATVTVTGTIGAGNALTAAVFSNIARFVLNPVTSMLTMVDTSDRVTDVSIAAATTITVTLSAAAGNYTVSIS
jgi:hypothetical protein